ncbi:DUF3147 family protein [Candidatus Gottesmanbacteria bacterium]|nr:DUF3147 family protein [Candidatus Gottesmanbacteria bacterium]
MTNIFLLQLLLAFIVGALWITTATIIAEKFGSKVGGIIAGMPSTIVIALFFIGSTQSVETATKTTTIIPAIMGLDSLFIAIYILLLRHKLFISLGISLFVWFISSFILVLLKFDNYTISLLFFIFFVLVSYLLVEKIVKVKSQGKRQLNFTTSQIIFRILLSGGIILLSVFMAKVGGYILGGVFASFPAIMLSTMIITYLNHGRDFSAAVMKVMMVSGSVNVTIYSIGVHFLYPAFGIITGTFISFAISFITVTITSIFVNKKMS